MGLERIPESAGYRFGDRADARLRVPVSRVGRCWGVCHDVAAMSVDVRESRFTALRGESFDAIAELAQGWDMEYHQLEAGPNPSDMIQLRLDGVDVAWERLTRTVLITGSPPPDSITFGLRLSLIHISEPTRQ